MQSHQSSFGEQINSAKAHGHQRRPSLGKSMPVSSLLLNFPPPPSTLRDYSSLSKDGLSPEFERPPIYFKVNDSESSSGDENIDNDYEMLVKSESSSNSEDQVSLVGNPKCKTPCLSCQNLHSDDTPLAQLCNKLCTAECSKVPPLPSTQCPSIEKKRQPLLRPPSNIEIQRKKFLTDMLYPKDDDCESDSADDVPELFEIVSNIIDKTPSPSDCGHSSSSIASTSQESTMLKDFREKFTIAEALAKTSAMTSPAVKRRLAARKVEMQLEYEENERRLTGEAAPSNSKVEIGNAYEPPRDLLLYLVR